MSYSARLKKVLSKVEKGSKIKVTSSSGTYTGILMPHHDFSDPDVVVIKLSSGYNVGLLIDSKTKIELLEVPPSVDHGISKTTHRPGLPNISVIGTGGTIASHIDYRTGAVHPAMSASDMVDVIGMNDTVNMSAKCLFSIFSENMNVTHWQEIAKAVDKELKSGADGVIITHGTDTMGYTAAALAFMFQNVNRPIVLVGSQRSSDRPSSDAYSNLTAAVRFCLSGHAGVFVVMHEGLSDDSFAVHLASRVRKMHTSRRDAFRSVDTGPAAIIDEHGNISFRTPLKKISDEPTSPKTKMEKNVVLLQYFPGMDPAIFRNIFMDSKGIVIAGTGLGHVSSDIIDLVKEAVANGTVVVMTSQCISGQTDLNVYDSGRDLIKAGAISVKDMLPETAYVKLMWALANTGSAEQAKTVMMTVLADEMSDRRVLE